jgi:hypothetical protein
MKCEYALWFRQESATGPKFESTESSPYSPNLYFSKLHFNMVVLSKPRHFEWLFFQVFRVKFVSIPLRSSACYVSCLSSFWFGPLNNISCYRLRSWSLCNVVLSPVAFPLLDPNILLSTLFLNTFVYVLLLIWGTNFQTHTKKQEIL